MFGFTDFNGQRLGDNAPEVMFSLVLNAAVGTGPGTAGSRSDTSPFVVPA
jgi:hypothetical protein